MLHVEDVNAASGNIYVSVTLLIFEILMYHSVWLGILQGNFLTVFHIIVIKQHQSISISYPEGSWYSSHDVESKNSFVSFLTLF